LPFLNAPALNCDWWHQANQKLVSAAIPVVMLIGQMSVKDQVICLKANQQQQNEPKPTVAKELEPPVPAEVRRIQNEQ
jgi:hypothetical protein